MNMHRASITDLPNPAKRIGELEAELLRVRSALDEARAEQDRNGYIALNELEKHVETARELSYKRTWAMLWKAKAKAWRTGSIHNGNELERVAKLTRQARADRDALRAQLRPEVLAFAQAMENQLRANDHKGGWKGCDYAWLFGRLLEEVKELEREVTRDGEHILSEAADVANFAMMIADVCGALRADAARREKP